MKNFAIYHKNILQLDYRQFSFKMDENDVMLRTTISTNLLNIFIIESYITNFQLIIFIS